MNQAHITAAHIVQRAVFAKLDCGSGDLGQHVGCAYDCWVSDCRNGGSRLIATDAFKAKVFKVLQDDLGYHW